MKQTISNIKEIDNNNHEENVNEDSNNQKNEEKVSSDAKKRKDTEKAADIEEAESANKKEAEHTSFENNLELTGLSRKEKRAAKKAQRNEFTKDMTSKEKFDYFIYYNKWKFIIAAIAVFFVTATIITIIKNSRPVALSYAVINHDSIEEPSSEPVNEYLKYYGFDDSYQVRASTGLHLTLEEYNNGTMSPNDTSSYQNFPIRCDENYYDIVFSDQNGIDYCLETYLLLPVENVLPAEMLDEINQKYPGSILGINSNNGKLTGYYIDVSNTDFVKKLHLRYSDVYLCFPGNSSKNEANTIKAVKYILNLDYNID